MFMDMFRRIFGRHFWHVTDPAHVVGNFNSHMAQAVVVFADEACFAGDAKAANKLKTLITEEFQAIEAKGKDVVQVVSCVHLFMASNEIWAANLDPTDRRHSLLDARYPLCAVADRPAYFAALREEMSTGGDRAFLHLLLARDIAGFNEAAFPASMGAARWEAKRASMRNVAAFVHGAVLSDGGVVPLAPAAATNVAAEDLYAHYDAYRRQHQFEPKQHKAIQNDLVLLLGDDGVKLRRIGARQHQRWVFTFGPLKLCREAFAGRYDTPVETIWPSEAVGAAGGGGGGAAMMV
jgi:hypothetical protein